MKHYLLILLLVLTACGSQEIQELPKEGDYENLNKATFAGGCFWCIEAAFDPVEGVREAISGYTGGFVEDPSYDEVTSGETGHYEAALVYYDKSINYTDLLDIFWRQIDPTDDGGQFADRGPQYRTAIFYHDEEQRRLALQSKKQLEESGIYDDPIVTQILPAQEFYEAEEYHQDYAEKFAARYKAYKYASGREGFLKKAWEKIQ